MRLTDNSHALENPAVAFESRCCLGVARLRSAVACASLDTINKPLFFDSHWVYSWACVEARSMSIWFLGRLAIGVF